MVDVVHAPDGRAIIIPAGELWLDNADALAVCGDELVDAGERDVTVDLLFVSMLCSDGVDAILHCDEVVGHSGGSLTIRNATGVVDRVVQITPLKVLVGA